MFSRRRGVVSFLVLGLLVQGTACGGGGSDPDAMRPADAADNPDASGGPDAPQQSCLTAAVEVNTPVTAGANANLFGVGPGSWVGSSSAHAAPGEILYVEAYANFIVDNAATFTAFKNWYEECDACIFLGTGCPNYDLPVTDGHPDTGPVQCTNLYMLDRGQVTLTAFDTDPVAGSLTGTIEPLTTDSTIRLVEVYKEGDASTPTGYGQLMAGGGCYELSGLTFDGSWGAPTFDAGIDATGDVDAGIDAAP